MKKKTTQALEADGLDSNLTLPFPVCGPCVKSYLIVLCLIFLLCKTEVMIRIITIEL